MTQGLHTSYGEESLKVKGTNSKLEKVDVLLQKKVPVQVDVRVAKNNFGWKLRGEKSFLLSMQ